MTARRLALIGIAAACAACPARGSRRAHDEEAGRAVGAGACPEPVGATVDVRPPPNWNDRATYTVDTSQALQAAIDRARPGEIIELDPRGAYLGPFTLRDKHTSSASWIVIRSARWASLPAGRIHPANAADMPKIQIDRDRYAIQTANGAHHYWLMGLEVTPSATASSISSHALVEIVGSAARMPHHIVVDRSYVHGRPDFALKRGVELNGSHVAVIRSRITEIHDAGAEAQGVHGDNGPGPFLLDDDYMTASSEAILFGGGDTFDAAHIPNDITITNNHLRKAPAWQNPAAGAPHWMEKNALELKNATHVLIEHNILEYSWDDRADGGQKGYAVLFTPRNQSGDDDFAKVQHVRFAYNVLRHVGRGFDILGSDDSARSGELACVRISSNLLEDVGGPWGTGDRFVLVPGPLADVAKRVTIEPDVDPGEIAKAEANREEDP